MSAEAYEGRAVNPDYSAIDLDEARSKDNGGYRIEVADNLTIYSPESDQRLDEQFYRRFQFALDAFSQSQAGTYLIKELSPAYPNRLEALDGLLLEEYASVNGGDDKVEDLICKASIYLGYRHGELSQLDTEELQGATNRIADELSTDDYLSRPVAFEIAYKLAITGKNSHKQLSGAYKAARELLNGNYRSLRRFPGFTPESGPLHPAKEATAKADTETIPSEILADAKCHDADPEVFFPKNGEHSAIKAAKRICDLCVVKEPCREYALEQGITYGVWGGLHQSERENMRRQNQFKESA